MSCFGRSFRRPGMRRLRRALRSTRPLAPRPLAQLQRAHRAFAAADCSSLTETYANRAALPTEGV